MQCKVFKEKRLFLDINTRRYFSYVKWDLPPSHFILSEELLEQQELQFSLNVNLALSVEKLTFKGKKAFVKLKSTEISADIKSMWYHFSRREDDYCIECSEDGIRFKQMRICHMQDGAGKIKFGVYACSPEDSSFKAVFTDMKLTDCQWKAHDGQKPDEV